MISKELKYFLQCYSSQTLKNIYIDLYFCFNDLDNNYPKNFKYEIKCDKLKAIGLMFDKIIHINGIAFNYSQDIHIE